MILVTCVMVVVVVYAFTLYFLKLKNKKSPKKTGTRGYSNYIDYCSVFHGNPSREMTIYLDFKDLIERYCKSPTSTTALQSSAWPGLGKLS